MKPFLLVLFMLTLQLGADDGMSERELLDLYADQVFRSDASTICIVTSSGDTVTFTDDRKPVYPEDYNALFLVDRLPELNLWVMERDYFEYRHWIIVNGADGSSKQVIAAPIPSPDGTWLLCANEDIMAGFTDNGIQVWKPSPEGFVLEFEDISLRWGPRDAMWEDDQTIVFEKYEFDARTYGFTTRPGKLVYSEGVWTPDDPVDWE
ncbi:MAG: hypothetical protein R6V62_11035 [Candidatus Fermentibacteraceae bacterium]